MSAVAADRAGDPACSPVTAAWPTRVGGHDRLPVSDDPRAVAAWGPPAVIARCGVTSPGPTQDDCLTVDGVDWVSHSFPDGMAFTTYGRDPAVEVLIPHDYAPEPLLLGAFTHAAAAIPQGEHHCR